MNGIEYSKAARFTDIEDYKVVDERISAMDLRILHAQLGIETESGEISDAIKKYLIYGKPLDNINLIEECGDLLWYLSLMLEALSSSFEEAMEKNIAKLKVRYPNKFTTENALNRNLNLERKVLE